MKSPTKSTRRCFIKATASAGAGLAVAFHLPVVEFARPGAHPQPGASFAPNALLRIDASGKVTVTVAETEIGQGVRTSLPMILAEELEADWASIQVEQASPGPDFKNLGTGGSWSIGGNWKALRNAGAAAREMLVSAAATAWGVDRATCRAERGAVVHDATNRRLGYGELVEAAAKLPVPADPPLKDPKDFKLLGRRVPRFDGPNIVRGKAIYGIDTRVPGMRFASVVRCPVLGGKPARWDSAKAKAVPGVRAVLAISSGIAVVADSTWAALQGREALEVSWDEGPNRGFDSEAFRAKLAEASRAPGRVTRTEGAGSKALGAAARKIEALYEYPFQAHAPVEPMNSIADARADRCEIWAPTQAPTRVREQVAKLLGLAPEAVRVNVTLVGGGFGRRLAADYACEAAELSRAAGAPVQVLWSRQDDMRHGHFQPASAHRMAGALDAAGAPVAWSHVKAGSYLSMFGAPEPKELEDQSWYQDSSWGAYDIPYSIPSLETSYVLVESPVPSGPWRSVYSPSCTFARECFLDEMAHAAGKDPLRFRLDLLEPGRVVKAGSLSLDQGRLRRVLEVAAEKAGWGAPLPAGRGRGVACNIYDGDTCLAYVVEVTAGADGRVRVDRVVCAVDCGIVVNPSGVEAQVEGGALFGLSTALHGQITIRNGRPEQSAYNDYPVVRMRDAPRIEIHIVPSTASPTGMGEPPVPPIAPAVANAIFAATGTRLRRLPFQTQS